jgi:ADP-ribosylglycohydrolase
MRVSPIGLAFDTMDRVLAEAERSAEVSHNHPEGIKGAQAMALAVFLARQGEAKESIRHAISQRFGYNLVGQLHLNLIKANGETIIRSSLDLEVNDDRNNEDQPN